MKGRFARFEEHSESEEVKEGETVTKKYKEL